MNRLTAMAQTNQGSKKKQVVEMDGPQLGNNAPQGIVFKSCVFCS